MNNEHVGATLVEDAAPSLESQFSLESLTRLMDWKTSDATPNTDFGESWIRY